MKTYKVLLPVFILLISFLLFSCGKKDETNPQLMQQKEVSADKDKELKDKEEFLKIKEQQLKDWEDKLTSRDSSGTFKSKITSTDTVKTVKDTSKTKDKKKEKFSEKEKELNKRLDNPTVAVNDYFEYIKRGVTEPANYDANMKKASELWENRTADVMKKNYKGYKKFSVTGNPEIVSQKGNTAVVKAKIKQSVLKNGKEEEKEVAVTYNLVADNTGKWKIKSNVVK